MKIVKGSIKEDRSRDVFWQKSFVENEQGELVCKLIVCATQEYLSTTLKKPMASIKIDDDMKKWFEEKTKLLYEKAKSRKNISELESLFDIYPQLDVLLKFAQSIQ